MCAVYSHMGVSDGGRARKVGSYVGVAGGVVLGRARVV